MVQKMDQEQTKIEKNYLRKKYHLDENIIYCPIANDNKYKKFELIIEQVANSDKQKFIIKAPVEKSDDDLKYGIFRYRPGPAEVIDDGMPNWN